MKKYLVLVVALSMITACGQEKEVKNTNKGNKKSVSSEEFLSAGMQFLNQQDVPSAIKSFDMAIKSDPSDVRSYLVLGQVYMRLKQFNRAADTFGAAVKVDPNNGEAFYMLSTNRMLDGRFEEAEKDAQRSVELFMLNRDEEKFKRSVALLKTISEAKNQQVAQ